MQKENLIEILAGIGKSELKRLSDFVASPFFNKSGRLTDFYSLLYNNYDRYKTSGLTKAELAKELYPGEAYDEKMDSKLRKLLSDFGKLVDTYLSVTKFMEDEQQPKLMLIKTLRERGVEGKFKKKLADLKKKQGKVKYRDEEYYRMESELLSEELELEFSKKMLTYSETDQRASDNLDYEFILNKLRSFGIMWAKQYYNRELLNYNWKFYDDIKFFIEKNIKKISSNHPVIYLQYLTISMFKDNDLSCIKTMKTFLNENFDIIPSENYSEFNWQIINYSMSQVNSGNIDLRKGIIEILKNLDGKKLIANQGDLLPSSFKIAVDTSIAEGEFDWTEYFINKYKNEIKEEFANGLTNLSLAKLNFFKGNYKEAKLYQAKVEYKDYIHYLDAKMLLARIEFEEGDYNGVLSAVDTLKKFLKSHSELPDIYLGSSKRFIKDIAYLAKLYEDNLLGKVIKIELEIFEENFENSKVYIYAKGWFIEKLEKLKTGLKS